MGWGMEELRLIGGTLYAPSFLPDSEIAACGSYRAAVRLSWMHRRTKAMTQKTIAELIGGYSSHISDYLNQDDKPSRRSLPADKLDAWAATVGNWAVQQWLMRQSKLTLMEEVIARRAA